MAVMGAAAVMAWVALMAAVECASVLGVWRADRRLAGRRECVSTTACDGGDGCGGGGGSGTEGGDGCSFCTIDRRPRAGADGGCCLCTMLSRPRAPSPRWRSSSRSRMSNSKKAASRRRAAAIACTSVGYTHIGYDTKTVNINMNVSRTPIEEAARETSFVSRRLRAWAKTRGQY